MSSSNFIVTLVQDTCKKCGGVFALSQDYVDECRRRGGFKQMWACPYCHTKWGFGEGEDDKLRAQIAQKDKQLAAEKRSAAFWQERRDAALREVEHLRRSRDGMKGALRRVSKKSPNPKPA